MDQFDEKDTEWYFQELTHLKQIGSLHEYVKQFQELAIMIPDLFQKRHTRMFIEGLKETTKLMVKPHEPQNLAKAIRKAKMVESNNKERNRNFTTKSSFTE